MWESLLHMLFPSHCLGCGLQDVDDEEMICLNCRLSLPSTSFESIRNNATEKIFWGRVPLLFASATFYYEEHSIMQQIIHNIKYKDEKALAIHMGQIMGDRLKELNQSWRDRGLPQIQIRAGIFTGPVTVGSLGGKERLEYAIIGDTVNIASRLESCEKHRQDPHTPCRVMIARQTLSYIYGEFEVESWGLIALKGKTKTVDVYKVIGRKSSI